MFIKERGAGSREQGAGSREQGAGSREQGAGGRGQGARERLIYSPPIQNLQFPGPQIISP